MSIPAHLGVTEKAKRLWGSIDRAWKFAMLGVVIFSTGLAVRFSWPNATLVFRSIYMIGLPLMLGGGLLAFWPKIDQVRQQDMQKSLRLAWYTSALAVPLIESGLVISAISATRVFGQYMVVAGIGVFIVLPWAVYALSIVVINEGLRTTAVLSLIPAASIFALPPFLAYLATNGSDLVPFFGPPMAGIAGYSAILLLMAVPVFLFVLPDMIRQRLASTNVAEQEREKNVIEEEEEEEEKRGFVLGWLVWSATVATALYGALLHFSKSPLAKVSLGQIIVANLFVAALLQPVYKRIATACWMRGIVDLVSLRGWREQQAKSWRLVKESWRKSQNGL